MKFKTFRILVVLGAVGLLSLIGWQCSETRAEQREAEAQRQAHGAAQPSVSGAPTGTGGGGETEAYLLATLGKPANSDKIKDATHGSGSKVNVYNENGVWARAKVDHDRDEKWDESWHIDSGVVVRRVAPNDDEQYTRELRKAPGAAWAEPGATPAPTPEVQPAASPTPAGAPALATGRELDDAVMGLLSRPVEEKIKDAIRGQRYKVNLYSDDKVRWNRAKVDLDRDDKFDEKWDFKPDGAVERQVAPADDEVYTETYVLTDGKWTRK